MIKNTKKKLVTEQTTDEMSKSDVVKYHNEIWDNGSILKSDGTVGNLDEYNELGPRIKASEEMARDRATKSCKVYYDDTNSKYYYFPKTCKEYKQRKQKEQQEKENKISTIDSFLNNFNIKTYRDYLSGKLPQDQLDETKEKIRLSLQRLNDKGFIGDLFTKYNELMDEDVNYTPKKEGIEYVDATNLVNGIYGWNIDKSKYPIYRPKDVTLLTKDDSNENCRQYLINYLKSAIFSSVNKQDFRLKNIQTYAKAIEKCSVDGEYNDLKTNGLTKTEVLGDSNVSPTPFDVYGKKYGDKLRWSDITKYIKSKNTSDFKPWESKKYNGSYIMPGDIHVISNLTESTLKLKIKSNLNEIILDKSRDELKETIIKNRVKFIFEKEEFKTEKEKINFVVNLLEESLSLKKQGFGNDLINEEFWDVTRGFFIDQNSKSFLNLFKQKATEWLVENVKKDPKLTPIIKEVISEINISNINNMTDQNFLVRQISNKLMLKNKQLTESHRVNEFKKEIQNRVSKVIIPIFEDTSDKFDLTFKKLKVR